MKKLLIAILFIIMLTTHVSAAPPPQIIIRGEEDLLEMRRMTEATDGLLTEYLGDYFPRNGIRNREDLISFLKLLDSLPIPYGEGMQFNYLVFYPGSGSQTFDIFFKTKTEETYSFRLFRNEDNGKSIIENSMNGEELVEVYRSQDDKMIVYAPPRAWRSFPTREGFYFLPMEINEFFISAIYNPENRGTSGITPENIYKGMSVISFGDGIWNTRYQNGDVNGDGVVNTADALEILKFAVGLPNVIIGDERAMAAADMNGDGRIDTEDALIVLRIAVGLAD